MDGIFISYRRQDASGHAGRLRDHLRARYGARVFQDVDDIPDGEVFERALGRALNASKVGIVVIGPTWLTATDAAGRRRLDDPEEWVRTEIRQLVERDIRVIPVLVGGARLPDAAALPDDLKALSKRQARELRDMSWDADVAALIKRLDEVLQAGSPESAPATPAPNRRGLLAGAIGAAVVVGIAGYAMLGLRGTGETPSAPTNPASAEGSAPPASAKPPENATVAAAQALQIVDSRWTMEDFSGMEPAADPSTVYEFVVDGSEVRLQPVGGAGQAQRMVARQIVGRALTLQPQPADGKPFAYLYVFELAGDGAKLDGCQTVNAADLSALGPCRWRYHRVPAGGTAAAPQRVVMPVACGRALPDKADPACVGAAEAAGLTGSWTGSDGKSVYRLQSDGSVVQLTGPGLRDEKPWRLLLRSMQESTVSFAWAGFLGRPDAFDAQYWVEYDLVATAGDGKRLMKCRAVTQLSARQETSQCDDVPAFLVQRGPR
jgi:hypothetical protein